VNFAEYEHLTTFLRERADRSQNQKKLFSHFDLMFDSGIVTDDLARIGEIKRLERHDLLAADFLEQHGIRCLKEISPRVGDVIDAVDGGELGISLLYDVVAAEAENAHPRATGEPAAQCGLMRQYIVREP